MSLLRTSSVAVVFALAGLPGIGCGSSDAPSTTGEEMIELEDPSKDNLPTDGKADWKSDNATDKGFINFGEEKSGPFETRYNSYHFNGVKDASIDISLAGNSDVVDTTLWLYGPKSDSGWGQPIAKNDNDDAGEGLFSKVAGHVLPADGEYLIVAAAKNRYLTGKSYKLKLTCNSDSCGTGGGGTTELEPYPRKAWTVFVYGSFDSHEADGIPSSLDDMANKVVGTDAHFVYLEDKVGDNNSKLWLVTKKNKEVVKDYGELHMGDPNTLVEALTFVRRVFPSNSIFLNLIGHTSSGLSAFMSDYTPAENYPWEKQRFMYWQVRDSILKSGGKVDVLSLSGCGTADLEIAARMSDVASYVVGLQEESFGYADVRWTSELSQGKVSDAKKLAWRVAEGQYSNGIMSGAENGAVGAWESSQVASTKAAFTNFVGVLNSKVSSNMTEFVRARRDTFEMISDSSFRTFVDARDFAEVIQQDVADDEVKSAAGQFITALNKLVPFGGPPTCADATSHERVHGINLLFPRPGISGSRVSSPDGFDECSAWPKDETSFYEETGWRQFVTSVYNAM